MDVGDILTVILLVSDKSVPSDPELPELELMSMSNLSIRYAQ